MSIGGGLSLTLDHLFRRATTLFRDREIVTLASTNGPAHRYTYGAFGERVRRLTAVLDELGVASGSRVATIAWNHHQHLETYFAIPLLGASLHTINARLHPDEVEYVLADAADRAIIADASLLHLVREARQPLPTLAIGSAPAGIASYDERLANAGEAPQQRPLSESMEMMVCHTSGTTGRPKGAAYTHRSTSLHSLALCTADGLAISEADCVMPLVPMYHAAAWGIPYATAMVGSKLVLPGPPPSAEAVLDAIAAERVTFSAAVPTVWIPVLDLLRRFPTRWDVSAWKRVMIGGAPVPRSLIAGFEELGIEVMHCWGMTETNPVAFRCRTTARDRERGKERRYDVLSAQGYPLPFVESRHRSEEGSVLPCDGTAAGELEVRGPWVVGSYLNDAEPDKFTDGGWFRTGDIVTIDEFGYARICDRVKDLIKSGGEWISSLLLETLLMNHPKIAEAAVFAAQHPKWGERPLAAVVFRDDQEAVSHDELRAHLGEHVPKFWIPDDFIAMAQVPRTSTGKFDKKALRQRYGDHLLTGTGTR